MHLKIGWRGVPLALAALLCVLSGGIAWGQAIPVDYSNGFTGATGLTFNENAKIVGSTLQLTTPADGYPGHPPRGSSFTTAEVGTAVFQTTFTFQMLNGEYGNADGLGFSITTDPAACGGEGGNMAYPAAPTTSIFIKFDTYDAAASAACSTTGLYINGQTPANDANAVAPPGVVNLVPSGVIFYNQNTFRCTMTYTGGTLTVVITDLTTLATATQTYTVDIPTLVAATAHVGFAGACGGMNSTQAVKTWAYSTTLAPTALIATPAKGQIGLSWTAGGTAQSYNVYRGTTAGGPYTMISTPGAVTTTSYTDTTAAYPNTYYYVVRAVNAGVASINSNEDDGAPLPPDVTVVPNLGLQTNENGATTTFNITFNVVAPAGGSVVTVTSNNPAEGLVSNPTYQPVPATTFTINVAAGQQPTIPITITGQNDDYADGAVDYTVTVTATGFVGLTIPDVEVTNNDNDTAGITFSKTAGLQTDEGLNTDTFTVQLNTEPYADITMTLTSSDTTEVTVLPATITFTAANWNTPQTVTVTGVDDALIDVSQPYTITTGALVATDARDIAAYGAIVTPDVTGVNLDNEVVPEAPKAWGNCGLLGLEVLVPLGLVGLFRLRRRRRNRGLPLVLIVGFALALSASGASAQDEKPLAVSLTEVSFTKALAEVETDPLPMLQEKAKKPKVQKAVKEPSYTGPFLDFDNTELCPFVGAVMFSSAFEADPSFAAGLLVRVPAPGLPLSEQFGIFIEGLFSSLSRDLPSYYGSPDGSIFLIGGGLDYEFLPGGSVTLKGQLGAIFTSFGGVDGVDSGPGMMLGAALGYTWPQKKYRITLGYNPQWASDGSDWMMFHLLGVSIGF